MRRRLAFIVSHPIQYYAPLYQRLARRDDLEIKVFFTWHEAATPVVDRGFGASFAWDIPLTRGYEFELVPNVASDQGTHRFLGLRNPSLAQRVLAWRPHAVHITGWAWLSHLLALREFRRKGVPTLFRGDSHLLDSQDRGPRWLAKKAVLSWVYAWPTAFLVAGSANRAYYEAFGVERARLHHCPHSVDVGRFAEPADRYEQEATLWRRDMGIGADQCVVLFAGKFERKKRPLDLIRAVQMLADRRVVLVMVGGGELEPEVKALAAADPERIRMLPFQNQSRMPVVYRLGDLFVLPSAYGETWGLAVNEALACGCPVLVSDRVGCAQDVVDEATGRIFRWDGDPPLARALAEMTKDRDRLREMGRAARERAWRFDIAQTEAALVACITERIH
jgi:glycosyltransferase involved in cell wall biosynthesis